MFFSDVNLPFNLTDKTVVLFGIALFLSAGLLMSRVVKPLKLPAVTGYLVAGILVGPFVLGKVPFFNEVITLEFVERFSIISDVALGFIAFAIGNEFRISQLKAIGKQATIIGIFQAVFTTLLVDAALIGLHFMNPDLISLSNAIVLGAIASATAPAATLMVVKQYKAKGKLTSLLMPIVAIDDAVGLVLFAVSLGIAKTFNEALYKAFLGAGIDLPKHKQMIITVKDADKGEAIQIGKRFVVWQTGIGKINIGIGILDIHDEFIQYLCSCSQIAFRNA